MSVVERRLRLARIWSNRILLRLGGCFDGDVVNVSAGDDGDKEGNTYATYFAKASSYSITNYSPGSFRGYAGRENEHLLDLTNDLPDAMKARFDVALNHTVMEHIFEVRKAFANLCAMSRDVVIVVVPFVQMEHESEAFKDYWRFTPNCLRQLLRENGLSVVYEAETGIPFAASYLLMIGARQPDRWRPVLPAWTPIMDAGGWVGGNKWLSVCFASLVRIWGRLRAGTKG